MKRVFNDPFREPDEKQWNERALRRIEEKVDTILDRLSDSEQEQPGGRG